jgi:hypothetical protein
MAGAEGEAARLLAQQHRGQIAVADAHLAIVGDGAGDAEGLQARAQRLGDLSGHLLVFPDGDSRADQISPSGVFERNVLDGFHDLAHIHILGKADLLGLFQRIDACRGKIGVDLRNPSFISFKQSHDLLLYSLRGLMVFAASAKRP